VTSNEFIAAGDTAIYELTWIDKSSAGHKVFNKWRVLVDPKTCLLKKTEYYTKKVGDSKYTLSSTMTAQYLSNAEIEAVIQEASF